MELKELTEKTLKLFDCETSNELSKKMLDIELNNNFVYYDKFKNIVQDLSIDWLQKIFQYYEADRKEKMQDYTPLSLARLCGKLTETNDEKIVYDMCAGTGALTIQKWNLNKNLYFVCHEFDANVIPYLLFNLAIRNINATVEHCDVLSGDVFNTYIVKSGNKYSSITKETEKITVNKIDSCISNPPYNMEWQHPIFAQMENRFASCELPSNKNANYAFVLTAIDKVKNKCSLILPCSVLTGKNNNEKAIRKYLVENNFIESIILNPNNMFEKTSIATCFMVINKNKTTSNVAMIDMRKTCDTQKREQKGQFGTKSHTNRTYIKEFNIYTDEQMQKAIDCIKNNTNIKNFCKIVSIQDIAEKDYLLLPSSYFDIEFEIPKHREFAEIVADINRVIKEKNKLKLTINETVAKRIGLYDLYQNFQESGKTICKMNDMLKSLDLKVENENFISLSKNAFEFKIENKSKEDLSTIILSIFLMWKQHIMFMNNEEDRYLIELRDALLPELMSGNIKL